MLEKLFGFDKQTMSVKKEVIGGITTFLTMAYIIAVNPIILSDAGMDKGAVFTVTILSAVIATLVMAIYAKLPFVLAPGMGLNAFFAYTIVLMMGYTWQFALTAVFLEGIIFILLTITGLRKKIVDCIPIVLRQAIGPGIGIFIAFIGLQSAGIVVNSDVTLVTMGDLREPSVLLAFLGIVISAVLLIRNITGALFIGILLTTLIGIPLGVTHIDGVVAIPPSIAPIAFKMEWHNVLSWDMVICVFTFLFIDMFDTLGTLLGVGYQADLVDENGDMKNINEAFMADAIGTTAGALMGTSTVTTFVESAAGVNAGGRSGLTAFSAAVCFLLSTFLAPLFLNIPTQATAPALILVGVMMMGSIRNIDFSNYIDAIPCFFTIILMPLAYSISDGIMIGVISYVLFRICVGKAKELSITICMLALAFILKFYFL